MNMKRWVFGVLIAATFSTSSNAVTYDLIATSSTYPQYFTGFTVRFDDTNGDMLLSIGEIQNFSGMTYIPIPITYYSITKVAAIPGFAVESGSPPTSAPGWWTFSAGVSNNLLADPTWWSYSLATVSPLPSAVPLPAALPLFVTALGVMGLLGWRRKYDRQYRR